MKQWKPHFNVFTIDFNEEYTALYGPFIPKQVCTHFIFTHQTCNNIQLHDGIFNLTNLEFGKLQVTYKTKSGHRVLPCNGTYIFVVDDFCGYYTDSYDPAVATS